MFIPEHFRIEDRATALAFMRANNFAILISTTPDGPFATHIPVVIKEDIQERDNQLVLRGHVAKSNPHWHYLEAQPQCLTIFHGPHAYISPKNYNTPENVPTWNYGAVHAYGHVRTYAAPQDLLAMLHDLIPTFEPAYAEQWSTLSETYRTRMLSHIVGFEITVTKLEAKFKLSQNRLRDEQQRVIESLSTSTDTAISGISQLMRERKLGLKKE